MKRIIGVTGGIGTGKSQVCSILEKCGVFVVDADIVARKVVEKGEKALEEIAGYFGNGVLLESGELNRKKLGEIVFGDEEKLGMLNQITHKYIIEETKRMIENLDHTVIAIEAALLIESGMHKMCDKVICVISKRENRISRIMNRDGMTRTQAIQRIDAQKPDEFYKKHADVILCNNDGMEELEKQVLNYKESICVSSC